MPLCELIVRPEPRRALLQKADQVRHGGAADGEVDIARPEAGIGADHHLPPQPVDPGLCDERMDLAGRVAADQRDGAGEERRHAPRGVERRAHLVPGRAQERRVGIGRRDDVARPACPQEQAQGRAGIAAGRTARRVDEAHRLAQRLQRVGPAQRSHDVGEIGARGALAEVADKADSGEPGQILRLAQGRGAGMGEQAGGRRRRVGLSADHRSLGGGRHRPRHVVIDQHRRHAGQDRAGLHAEIGDDEPPGVEGGEFGRHGR
ncbi:hypothetical protein CHKEEEPN_3669 [Methylorubrum podarium]|nr:hypothetical protein CHKEEEPN_3669 [Methylorubrum podarium]